MRIGFIGLGNMGGPMAKNLAAAHHEALHEGDDRLGIIADRGVHLVFVGEEALAHRVIAGLRGVIDRGNVAAGAERLVPLGVEDHQLHGLVVAPGVERGAHRVRHLVAQRVQRLRSGQGDAPRGAVLTDLEIVHQPLSASIARPTIRRMISLVPSRIWCTRRSRTIFSIP